MTVSRIYPLEIVLLGKSAQPLHGAYIQLAAMSSEYRAYLVVRQRYRRTVAEIVEIIARVETVQPPESAEPKLARRIFGDGRDKLVRQIIAPHRSICMTGVVRTVRTGAKQ